MKKKLIVAAMSFSLLFTLGTGSVFADSKLDQVIDSAIGTKYVSGGTSTAGFDCSGFTSYVYSKLGIKLPHQSRSQFSMGTSVAKKDLREGDLVFFNTSGQGVSHVGIYVGDNKFAHASTKRGVIISSLDESYYQPRYVGAKRIMSSDTYNSIATEGNEDHDDVE